MHANRWSRPSLGAASTRLGLEPFRCSEPAHRVPRVRWIALVEIVETGAFPECCDQPMELVPRDEADAMRDEVGR